MGVVVFANSKSNDYNMLPKGAKAARRNAGDTIPMIFITTANGEEEIDAISYIALSSDMRDAKRDLKDKLETVNVLSPSESDLVEEETASTAEIANAMLAEEPLEWTNTEGRKITAAVKSFDGDKVLFLINGNEIPYPISQLSQESQEMIHKLAEE